MEGGGASFTLLCSLQLQTTGSDGHTPPQIGSYLETVFLWVDSGPKSPRPGHACISLTLARERPMMASHLRALFPRSFPIKLPVPLPQRLLLLEHSRELEIM